MPQGKRAITPIELRHTEKLARGDEQVLYVLCFQTMQITKICK